MIIEPEGRSFGFKCSVHSSPFEPLEPPHGLNCPPHYTCPSFRPHLPPHLCPLLFLGISHLLRLVLQELNLFYSRDVNGVCLLYDLLHSPWLQALLKVSAPLLWSRGLRSGTCSSSSVTCHMAGKLNREKVQGRPTQPQVQEGNCLRRAAPLFSAPTFLSSRGPRVTKQPPKMAIGNPISSCPRPLVLEVNSGQIKRL